MATTSSNKSAYHVVFAGLSASGKTTLVTSLGRRPGTEIIPEHNDWIGGSQNFPKAPGTIAEKKSKQEFFINIDLDRHRWVEDHRSSRRLLISDADFTSPLAHNYAERWLMPHLDVYGWMVQRYCSLLERGELAPANLYVYLDATLAERKARRATEYSRRKRNDMFFTGSFPDHMRRFYWILMHPDSPRAVLPAYWHQHSDDSPTEEARIWAIVQQKLAAPAPKIDLQCLVERLRSTVTDRAD